MDSKELQCLFSENLKFFRLLNNLTQQQLAELADISVGFLCDLESGKKWGTSKTVVKLSNALNIEPYQLYINHKQSENYSTLNDLLSFSKELEQYIDTKINTIITKNNL